MRAALSLICLVLALSGCLSTDEQTPEPAAPAPEEPAPEAPAEEEQAISCEEHCVTLERPDCEGRWEVSGTYPDCVCDYVCDDTEPPQEEASPDPSSVSIGMTDPITDQDVLALLDTVLSAQRTDFYRQHSGTFHETTYKWLRWFPPGGEKVIEISPAGQIAFDGKAIESIQTFGFITFNETSSGTMTPYGAGIFGEAQTRLDSLAVFDIDYLPAAIALKDCQVYRKEQSGDSLTIYYLSCRTAAPMD